MKNGMIIFQNFRRNFLLKMIYRKALLSVIYSNFHKHRIGWHTGAAVLSVKKKEEKRSFTKL